MNKKIKITDFKTKRINTLTGGKIDKYKIANPLDYNYDLKKSISDNKKMRSQLMSLLLKANHLGEENQIDLTEIEIDDLKKWLLELDINKKIKKCLIDNLNSYTSGKAANLI